MSAPQFCLGFDLSLLSPAAIAIPLGWRPGEWRDLRVWMLNPKAPESNEDIAGRFDRYAEIADWAWGVAADVGAPARYFIEQYAFNKNNANASKLMELGGIVRMRLYHARDMIPTIVSTASARKLLLGKVPEKDQKLEVQGALYRAKAPLGEKLVGKWIKRWRAPIGFKELWNEDACDAFCVANFGLTEFGLKALTLAPKTKAKTKKRAA